MVHSFFLILSVLLATNSGPHSALEEEGYTLVWSDEFDYQGLPNPEKWGYDVGDGCPNLCGWGNNELQYYTEDRAENARVEDGVLVIEAHRELMGSRAYSSARLVSRNRGDWQFGYIEVKAKLPQGRGTWPAIWMLPTDWQYGGWPASGEIDIMEHVGFDPLQVHGTVHTQAYNHMVGTQQGAQRKVATAFDDHHVYAIKWTPEQIEFLIDGEVYNQFANDGTGSEAWPFDQRFHLLLNIAVGGNWGGREGVDESVWPARMEIDYVRVYQKNG